MIFHRFSQTFQQAKDITENIEHLHWFDGFQVQHRQLHHLPGMGKTQPPLDHLRKGDGATMISLWKNGDVFTIAASLKVSNKFLETSFVFFCSQKHVFKCVQRVFGWVWYRYAQIISQKHGRNGPCKIDSERDTHWDGLETSICKPEASLQCHCFQSSNAKLTPTAPKYGGNIILDY